MVFARTVMLAVLALASAIAPAVPCTMGRHAATADRPVSDAPAPRPRADHAPALQTSDAPDGAGDAAQRARTQDGSSATAGDDGWPGHRSQDTACPSPCGALGGQAALPTAAGVANGVDDTSSARVPIGRADGAVDAHPFRIERPPRLAA